jgi:ATP-dependent RNA helicase DDX54/DBP10
MSKDLGKGSGLVSCLLIGGDSMEGQFSTVHSNKPDFAIATPGRFLHLAVEMSLSLSDIQYVVFDEADRYYLNTHLLLLTYFFLFTL